MLIDADGRVVFYNDGAARIIGQPFEALGREGDVFEVADMDIRPHGQAERAA